MQAVGAKWVRPRCHVPFFLVVGGFTRKPKGTPFLGGSLIKERPNSPMIYRSPPAPGAHMLVRSSAGLRRWATRPNVFWGDRLAPPAIFFFLGGGLALNIFSFRSQFSGDLLPNQHLVSMNRPQDPTPNVTQFLLFPVKPHFSKPPFSYFNPHVPPFFFISPFVWFR